MRVKSPSLSLASSKLSYVSGRIKRFLVGQDICYGLCNFYILLPDDIVAGVARKVGRRHDSLREE
jgi:hypothetical protein